MKAMKTGWLVAGAVAIIFAGMAHASDTGAQVRKTCSMCHTTARICMNLGVKDEAAWTMTIKRMITNGARVSTEQIEPWAAYLGELEAGSKLICD